MGNVIATYKHFYQRVEFYAAVALPWVGLLIDALNNEIKHGSLDYGNVFPMLAKLAAGLTAVYTFGMGLERSAIAKASIEGATVVPVVTASTTGASTPSSSLVA